MDDRLADEFHQAMLDIYDKAKEHDYHATYFLRMIQQHGGVNAAKRLLQASSAQYGLSRLWELGLLHISVEALVVQKRWAPLFTDAEQRKARERLLEYGYDPS